MQKQVTSDQRIMSITTLHSTFLDLTGGGDILRGFNTEVDFTAPPVKTMLSFISESPGPAVPDSAFT